MATEEHVYHPKDAVSAAVQASLITGTAGLFMSAVQSSLARQNIGLLGVFTKTGGHAAAFAIMGGAYSFSRNAAANLRAVDDTYNVSIGGFVGGAIMGLRARTLPAVLGYGTLFSVVLSAFEYTGGSLWGHKKDSDVDEFERKEKLRKNKRRPIQETIDELGEGRGIYGPGYAERRRETIKQNYGIDIGPKED